ncbi:hypothetical protein IGI04_019254 [Brassica rapa subsp. trilocularis]|uniref:Uncharacterized protein n=1 Tax=Brassica rapa subsp. trilocularis TaxID=1813537 RepID=A0ABQ7MFA3_BRACM|nr:hypothetical protein IGI04_019254 [Brassica rapa subsp. trilocularis]
MTYFPVCPPKTTLVLAVRVSTCLERVLMTLSSSSDFFEKVVNIFLNSSSTADRPRSTDQYMEPNQHEDQDVLKFSTEVHDFHHTGQTDRTVPNASGWELCLEPWPDDRFHCTRLCLHRSVFHLMKNSRDGIAFGRTDPELGHCYTFLDSTTCTARMSSLRLHQYPCPDDRIHRTGARISRTDWHFKSNGRDRFGFGRVELKIGRDTSKLATLDCPACVLAQSAGHASGSNEPGRNLKGFSLVKNISYFLGEVISKFRSFFCWTRASHPATIECHRSYHQFSILSDLSSYQPYRKSDPYFGSIKWYQSHSSEIESFIWGLVVEEKACWLRRNPAFEVKIPLFTMFGLQRKSNKEKHPRLSVSQTSFKSSLNYCDECVSVQKKPNRWSKEHVNTSKGESDPRRRLLQFDVQQFCDNFVKGVDKALKDVSKSQKKSTSTRAPVAEPSFSISKKTQGESENCFEEFNDFSDSSPIFDETDEEPIGNLMSCEESCDLPYLESEFINDNEQANVELTVLQPEHPSSLVLSHQEDESGPVFDDEETSIMSTFMKSNLCFDSGTTTAPSSPAPLLHDLQEHCEEPSSLNSLPDMVVKVSTDDVIHFGLDKMKKFCVSKSVFDNMINSLKIFEPDKCLDQSRFQNVNGITSGIILSSDQFLEHNKGFHLLGRPFDLDLQQTDFCAEKSLDSLVCKGNSFDLSSSRHVLITDEFFASSYALDEILIQKLLEQKSLETENDFRDLEFCGSVLQPDILSFETDNTWHFLRSFRDNGVVLSSDDILVYNTFFEKCLELLINDSQTELKLVCSDVGKDIPILKMNTVVAYLDKILVCNIYFNEHLERLKNVQFVLGKDILICDLNKYLSCTFDPGLLVFELSIQERQVQPLNESIGRAQQPQIWRSFVVQTGYLGASDRGSVQEGYLNSPKVFCLESNFTRKPTHQGFTEAWNRMKSFTDEEVMNFPNRRFFSPSIREYQISKGDSCPRKNRPEPKPILHEPKVFPRSFSCLNQKHCKDHELIASTLHENVLKPRISKRKHILTWLKNVLLKPFHELISLSCALKEIWCRKKHELKLLRPKNSFDFVHDDNFSNLALSLSFHNSFSPWPDFEIDKSIFGNQLTCLMLTHVLDDYPKGLDPDFDVLRIEKPFDYFFGRFDEVSLVALNKQDKHDQFLRRASTNRRQSTLDLRTNPFEERGNDRPRSTDQYMEPNQHEDQDVLKFSTEVHDFHHTGQTDRTVPNASGWELWLEPWPDDRFHCTGLCLHRPVFHLMKNSRDGIAFGRTDPELGHCYTFLDSTTCTARMSSLRLHQYPCPDDRIHRTGARISRTDWHFKSNGRDRFGFGRVELKIGRDTSKLATLDCPACVLAQSAGHASGSNEPGRNLKGFSLVKVTFLSLLVRLSPSFDPSFVGPVYDVWSPKEKKKPNRWSKEHVNTSKGESDPRRRLLQFDVQQFCDNFVKGVDKALKDVSKSQKKSTSTRAPVAEPSFSISKKTQGESENCFEEFNDFSDSSPIFDETDEEPIGNLMSCEESCDLPYLESEFINDNEQANVELTVLQPEHPSSLVLSHQVFEEEPLNFPHQCPCLDTWISLDDGPDPMFDEEDESGPVFDDEETSIMSTFMKSHLCFDSGTTTAPSSPAPLLHDLQEHCEEPSSLNSLPDMVVKVSTDDVIRFGLDKMKKFCVSKSVFDNMINSLKIFEPDKCLDQSRFQNVNGITSGIILSSDQFLEHNKGFHLLGRPFDLDLQQTDFCAEKSLDSLVCKGNSFDLSSSRHVLITDEFFASSYALDEILIQKLLEQKSLETENDFRDLEFCGSVLQPDILSFETDNTWHFLRSFRDNGVVLSSDDILVYNTFFEKCLELLINDSQTELKLVCSDVGKDMPILKMNTVVAYLDKILVCNIYFNEHLERLKNVQFVLGKDILICDLNKYLSCTFDPGLLVFELSIQERQVQPLNESIGRAQQPQIWRSFVVQTGYLGASDRGSVQEGYLNSPKVFCLESNFTRKPTHQGFTEAWNRMKSFTDEEVMNFPNRRFFSPSIREYQISKGDSCPRKNRPEPKPILHEPKVFPRSFSCLNQKHCKDHELIASTLHENVLKPRISKRTHILTWLKNVLLKPFHELISLSCALKEIWCRKKHELKLLRPKNSFDFVHDDNFSNLALSLSFHNSFSPWPDFEIDKSIFGNQLTCLMLTHVLDDYPKGLDPDFDVLRIEKPFDYFFGRFDEVSLVALNKQDKHDQFLRRASTNRRQSTLDLRTNHFEERRNDRPRSTDQYMEPNQHEDQDVLKFSTEVHDFHHTGQTDRTVPNASGWELCLEPWPDDRFHCTRLCLHRPVFHLMKNSRDGIAFGRTDPELGHCYTFLDSTTCTARMSSLRLHQYPCPDDRIHQTGARISRTDWHFKSNGRDRFGFGRVELKIGRDTSKLATLDCPACVLAQSAGHASGSNEPGRNLKGFSLVKVTFLSLLVRLSPSFDPSFVGLFSFLTDRVHIFPIRLSVRSLGFFKRGVGISVDHGDVRCRSLINVVAGSGVVASLLIVLIV